VSLVVLPPGRAVEPAEGRAIHCLEDGRVVVWQPETACGAIACHASPLPRSRIASACAFSRAQVKAALTGGRAVGARVRTQTLVRPELGLVVSLGILL
jgi:hypothetical protein